MIELLVVVIIAFLLLALFGVLWRNLDERNRKSRAQAQLAYLQNALQDYRNEIGAYPPTLDLITNRLPRTFTTFSTNGAPLDPWDVAYSYVTNDLTYTLYSCGPDTNETTAADNIYPGRF